MHHRLFFLAISLLAFSTVAYADDAVPSDPQPRWWRGNIHTHSLWSDGDDFPEMVSEWYRTHDYHFLAISDHNVLAEGRRWMRQSEIEKRSGGAALQKYLDRFGSNWVETRAAVETEASVEDEADVEKNADGENNNDVENNTDIGDKADVGNETDVDTNADVEANTDVDKNIDAATKIDAEIEIRLKPFHEYRALLEERGRFLLLQGEEISDSVGGKPIHMNVTNVHTNIAPLSGDTVPQAIEANLRAVEVQSKKTGQAMLVHLNHPNFGYAVTAEELAEVVSERFFEVYNGHRSVNQLGDAAHPSIDRMWDIANTIRLARYHAAPLFGVATDDSHDYHGGDNSPGRGWIMVRARHLTPESLIQAMKRGDFYASTGVTLSDVTFDENTRELGVEFAAKEGVTYETRFIGTLESDLPSQESFSDSQAWKLDTAKLGIVLHSTTENPATFQLPEDALYVRAEVVSSKPHPNSSYANQMESAWTQPVGWEADEVKK